VAAREYIGDGSAAPGGKSAVVMKAMELAIVVPPRNIPETLAAVGRRGQPPQPPPGQ
jgi:16S rRNA C967 or C1407 C5-methylase (RsmB/RsmF family)